MPICISRLRTPSSEFVFSFSRGCILVNRSVVEGSGIGKRSVEP